MPTARECFQLHRYLLLALMSSERARAGAAKAHPSGSAILLRVVYPVAHPLLAGQARTALRCARAIDPMAILAAPHPLHRQLLAWAPRPSIDEHLEQAEKAQISSTRAAIDHASVVHLAFAPGTPNEPMYVMSASAREATGDIGTERPSAGVSIHRYQHSTWSGCQLHGGLHAEMLDALRRSHVHAVSAPSGQGAHLLSDEDLSDLHESLRVRALAQRAKAITTGEISSEQPFVPCLNLQALNTIIACHQEVEALPSARSTAEIESTFDSLLVRVALRESERQGLESGFGALPSDQETPATAGQAHMAPIEGERPSANRVVQVQA